MKKLYTILLLSAVAIPAMAQQMFVETDNGTESMEFSKLDNITFNGTTVEITQTDGTAMQSSMGAIKRIHFSNYSRIEKTQENTQELVSYVSSDEIAVNCNAGDVIDIYDIIGSRLVCMRQESDNGIISIAQFPKGIYIIKTNDRTAKFVKR